MLIDTGNATRESFVLVGALLLEYFCCLLYNTLGLLSKGWADGGASLLSFVNAASPFFDCTPVLGTNYLN